MERNIKNSLIELIGSTPLLRLSNIFGNEGSEAEVLVKIEYFNPGGSVKDRAALSMIEDAEKKGLLKPGGTIIEPTSGNTGVGLAWIAAIRGYKLILTMPETMSIERRMLLKAYGGELVLTPGNLGMKGAIEKAEELNKSIPGSVILRQFDNPANPAAHKQTAKEIWKDTAGNIDCFIACVGTGGTLTGTGRALKAMNPDINIIGDEPASSPVLSGGKAGAHKIQGIGAGFVPSIYDSTIVDRIITITDDEAMETMRLLARTEGLLVGISSGAAVSAALKVCREEKYKGKRIVVLLPDTGERYLSSGVF